MNIHLKFKSLILVFVGTLLFSVFFQNIYAQNKEKNVVRIQAYYTKIMDSISYIDIKAVSKIDKKTVRVSNINLIIYNEYDDEKIEIGNVITNMEGESRFLIKNLNALKPDSTNTYNILLTFKGDSTFKKASKSISFKNAHVNAELINTHNINYISATLTNASTKEPIIDETLIIQVQRLFKPLKIETDLNITNEDGSILVPIEEGIPGVNGYLTFEVVLNESDEFGTVKALLNEPIGTPIVEESTFDERTMWSPRNKTPIFLLIIPNLLTFGMWGIIIYLITNLFKIKNN